MSSEQGEMSPAAPPLEDDNLLSEILLRLPPQPSSLPRASAVCKRWHSVASDQAFSRRFRCHHRRSPPIIGCFHGGFDGLFFEPNLESPNRVSPERFSFQLDAGDCFQPLGCRHGLVLLLERNRKQVLLWNPFTGDRHPIDIPPGIDPTFVKGAVIRSAAAGDAQHFQVVLVVADNKEEPNSCRILVRVYSSQTGVWGNLISTPIPYGTQVHMQPAVLVGDSLYWFLVGGGSPLNILEFDLERQRLAVIEMPTSDDVPCFTVMRAEGGGLGFLSLSGFTAQLWKRKTDSHGVASWEMGTTLELDNLLSLDPDKHPGRHGFAYPVIHGFAEDNNLVFLSTFYSLFTVQLDSFQFEEIPKPRLATYHYHPFESVYAAGI